MPLICSFLRTSSFCRAIFLENPFIFAFLLSSETSTFSVLVAYLHVYPLCDLHFHCSSNFNGLTGVLQVGLQKSRAQCVQTNTPVLQVSTHPQNYTTIQDKCFPSLHQYLVNIQYFVPPNPHEDVACVIRNLCTRLASNGASVSKLSNSTYKPKLSRSVFTKTRSFIWCVFRKPHSFNGRILRFSRTMDPYRTESTTPWIFPLGRRSTYCSESGDFPLSPIQEGNIVFS